MPQKLGDDLSQCVSLSGWRTSTFRKPAVNCSPLFSMLPRRRKKLTPPLVALPLRTWAVGLLPEGSFVPSGRSPRDELLKTASSR